MNQKEDKNQGEAGKMDGFLKMGRKIKTAGSVASDEWKKSYSSTPRTWIRTWAVGKGLKKKNPAI